MRWHSLTAPLSNESPHHGKMTLLLITGYYIFVACECEILKHVDLVGVDSRRFTFGGMEE